MERVLLFRVRVGDSEPRYWSGEINDYSTLVIGVPREPVIPIKVLFCRTGGSLHHGILEGYVPGQLFNPVRALCRRRGLLSVLVPPKEEVDNHGNYGIKTADHLDLLTEGVLDRVIRRIKAAGVEFVVDNRNLASIQRASGVLPAREGVQHLKIIQSRRTSE